MKKREDFRTLQIYEGKTSLYLFGGYVVLLFLLVYAFVDLLPDATQGIEKLMGQVLYGLFIVGYVFAGIKVYQKFYPDYRTLKQIREKLRYFVESNNLYEISTFKKMDKNGKEYSQKQITYYPKIMYRIANGALEIAFRLDGSSISQKFRDFETSLSDCFNLSCDDSRESDGYVIYEFKTIGNPLKTSEKTDYRNYCNEEEMLLADDLSLKWNFRKSPHALIVGDTGSGKTFFLMYLLKCLKSVDADIRIIDPKRADLLKIGKGWDIPAECEGNRIAMMLREVEQEMDRRYDDMTEIGVDYYTLGMKPLFVIFDEVMAFMAGSQDAKLVKEVNGYLMNIIAKGRQSGVFMVITMQRPDAKFLDAAIRDQLGMRVSLGSMTDDGVAMVFGNKYRDRRPRTNEKGSGLIHMKHFNNSRPRDFITPRMENAFILS